MKKILLTLVALVCALSSWAYTYMDENGICYYFSGSNAYVTYFYRDDIPRSDDSYDGYAMNAKHYTGDIVIPETVTYNGTEYTVTGIGGDAFYKASSITSISLPASITCIGYDAFYSCTGLKAVYITDLSAWCKISFNSSNPLYYAHNLYVNNELVTDLVIPDDITEIKPYAFNGCNASTINIHDGVTKIGSYGFASCSNVTSIELPESVQSIGEYAFSNCSKLQSIELPESVQSIGESAFRECSALENVNIPEGITIIGNYTFYNCSKLQSIELPESVQSIGGDAFYQCSALENVNIPEGITIIKSGTFYRCI